MYEGKWLSCSEGNEARTDVNLAINYMKCIISCPIGLHNENASFDGQQFKIIRLNLPNDRLEIYADIKLSLNWNINLVKC